MRMSSSTCYNDGECYRVLTPSDESLLTCIDDCDCDLRTDQDECAGTLDFVVGRSTAEFWAKGAFARHL
jgi:hypothetical protein